MKINTTIQYQPVFERNPNNFLLKNSTKIEQMLESGATVKEIASTFNTDIQAIYRFLRIKKINPPQRQKKAYVENINNVLLANIKLFVDKNLTIEAIAQKTKCTVKDINTWLTNNEHNIKSLLRLEMFKSGMSIKEVANECGITIERAGQLKRKFQKENLISSGEQRKKTNDIQNDIRSGMTTKELTKKYKLSESSIYRYKKIGKITKDEITPIRKQRMIAMIKEGLGIRDMARQLEVSEAAVKFTIKKHGLKELMNEVREKIELMIFEDAQKGVYLDALAKKYGYSKRTISYKIQRCKERLEKLKSIDQQ